MHDDMTPEELERAALSTLTSPDRVVAAARRGVDADSFQVAAHADVWAYLNERVEKGEVATFPDVLAITGVQLIENLTDDDELVGALAALSLQRRMRRTMIESNEVLMENPELALTQLVGELGALSVTVGEASGHVRRFGEDSGLRLKEFDEMAAEADGTPAGLPTGLPVFDDQGAHWHPGELASIIGATNAGKSFLMLWLASRAYLLHGSKVLFLSPESTVQDIEYRLDPIAARHLGFEISNSALRSNTQDRTEYARYIAAIGEPRPGAWITRDSGDSGSFTAELIISLAREHLAGGTRALPNMLCIDGFHLIAGEGKTWESMQHAALRIKGLAQDMGIVVLTVSQAQRTVLQDVGDAPDLASAAYGMALMEASNRVIGIAERRGQPLQRLFKVPKARDGVRVTQRQYLTFDVDTGLIGQLNPDVKADGKVDF